MRQSPIAFAFLLVFTGAGCSSTTTPTPSATDAGSEHPADAGTHDDSGSGAVDSGADAASGKPATPEVLSVEPLAGGLHVMWKLNGTGLTGVELWRKKDAGTYAKAYTLPGTATSQHDEAAMAPGKYCYQVMTIPWLGHVGHVTREVRHALRRGAIAAMGLGCVLLPASCSTKSETPAPAPPTTTTREYPATGVTKTVELTITEFDWRRKGRRRAERRGRVSRRPSVHAHGQRPSL